MTRSIRALLVALALLGATTTAAAETPDASTISLGARSWNETAPAGPAPIPRATLLRTRLAPTARAAQWIRTAQEPASGGGAGDL